MEKFREFFSYYIRDGITCLKRAYGREVCIKFHPKGTCTRGCSLSHVSLRGQTQADYIHFLDHCSSGYKARNYNSKRKRKSSGDRINFIDR